MGQGHHGGILYGCLYSGRKIHRSLFGNDGDNGLMDQFRHAFKDEAQPDESYETERQWVGFWVAELDDCLIGRRNQETACLAYQAVPLTEAAINARFGKEIATAKKKWECFARFLADRGLVLEGSLNLVFDYD